MIKAWPSIYAVETVSLCARKADSWLEQRTVLLIRPKGNYVFGKEFYIYHSVFTFCVVQLVKTSVNSLEKRDPLTRGSLEAGPKCRK